MMATRSVLDEGARHRRCAGVPAPVGLEPRAILEGRFDLLGEAVRGVLAGDHERSLMVSITDDFVGRVEHRYLFRPRLFDQTSMTWQTPGIFEGLLGTAHKLGVPKHGAS